jgi:hypothetical protein
MSLAAIMRAIFHPPRYRDIERDVLEVRAQSRVISDRLDAFADERDPFEALMRALGRTHGNRPC